MRLVLFVISTWTLRTFGVDSLSQAACRFGVSFSGDFAPLRRVSIPVYCLQHRLDELDHMNLCSLICPTGFLWFEHIFCSLPAVVTRLKLN